MGLSDGAIFIIKHTPLPNGNHSILSPICPMGVADTLEHESVAHESHAFMETSADVDHLKGWGQDSWAGLCTT